MLDSEKIFALDKHHLVERGAVYPVCGNTYRMLQQTRFKEYFEFIGTWDTHYGIYQDCGTSMPFESSASETDGDGNDGGCC